MTDPNAYFFLKADCLGFGASLTVLSSVFMFIKNELHCIAYLFISVC